jgi:hypothetical protein
MPGFVFGIIFGALFWIIRDLHTAIIAGLITGISFGTIMGAFTFFMDRKYRGKGAEVTGNPNIIMEGPANHFFGKEGVGGWLYLTDKELYFKSHSINVHAHIFILPLGKIEAIERIKFFGIIPTGLMIITTEGKIERFVAYDRKKWVQKIEEGILGMR